MTVYKAQATYIAFFTQLMEWPDDNNNSFLIGVAGNDELVKKIDLLLAGSKVKDKLILVKKVNNTADFEKCKILFVSFDKNDILADIIKISAKYSILVVTERAGSLEKGAMINFVMLLNILKYEMNEEAILNARIKLNPAIIKMAYKPKR